MAEVYLQRLMTPPPPTPHPLVCGAISSNLGTDRIIFEREGWAITICNYQNLHRKCGEKRGAQQTKEKN